MSAKRLRAYLLLLIVSVIWGLAGAVIKFTQRGIDTLPFLTYRFGISTVIALTFFVLTKPKFPKKLTDLIQITVYGLLVSTVSLGLLFWGLESTTVIEAEIISATAPILASFMGAILLKEHVIKREKIGMAIAFAGTVFIVLEPLLNNGTNKFHVLGNILVFLYIVFNSYSAILAKKLLRKDYAPATLTNFGFIVGFISIAIFSIYKVGFSEISTQVLTLQGKYHLGVLFMALVSGTLAYTMLNKAQKAIEVGEVAVFSYLIPVFGIPTAVLWLGEKLTPNIIIGALVVAIGVFIAEMKSKKGLD